MASKSRVNILINNYNYAQFLETAINSALNQTYPTVEVIVVDDGSTDNSWQIIKKYQNKITPILKQNGGQASAFNAGFKNSQCDIICFLDADDIFLPKKLEKVVSIFEKYPDIGWCFHPLKLVSANDEVIDLQVYEDKSGVYDVTSHMKRGKLRGKLPLESIVTSGMCLRRSLLEKILPMPEEIRITSDDYIKYAALGMSKGFILLEELGNQRIHGNNAYTQRSDKKQVASEVAILTAYNLKANFPFLSVFVNKIFAYGIATYANVGSNHVDFNNIINEYISSLAIFEKMKVMIRAKIYSIFF
ncbi:probable glycosyl transferase [Rivularia sp. IAM M-261]|nr:probable glycosyl transferase [Rivularia sp. IAM M-261]